MLRRALFLLSLSLAASAQTPWQAEQKNVQIPMRDGKSLAADIFLPAKEGAYPTVLIQTPYNKTSMGSVLVADAGLGETGRGAASDMKQLMDREKYAYVIVDWRGFYGSKAAMQGVKALGFKRGLDGFDTVEWIAKQPWSNGKIGTWGGSALGKQQLDTAAENPPHLVCCVPLIAAMGQEYSMYYEGGVFREGHALRLDSLGFGVAEKVKAAPLSSDKAWKWASVTYRPATIKVPCLFITGWWDHFPDLIVKNFEDVLATGGESARAHSRLLIGPWDHVGIGVAAQGDTSFPKAELASAHAAKLFLDYWLLDAKDNGEAKQPRVTWWGIGEDTPRTCESWSALPRESRTLWLTAEGKIAEAKPADAAAAPKSWTYDPRKPSPTLGGANLPPMKHGPTDQSALSARTDGAWYSTGALATALRIDGNVELTFDVTGNRPDYDIAARLCMVAPGGKPLLLADAILRAKFREGTDQPKLMKDGDKVRVTLRFPMLSVHLPAGHELRVYLSNGNWSRYERNPHTGADHWDEKSAVTLDFSVDHAAAELKIPFEAIPGKK